MGNSLWYVLKIHMSNGTVTTGPYKTLEEAHDMLVMIGNGDVNTVKTQQGGESYLVDPPVYVEALPFHPREMRKDAVEQND